MFGASAVLLGALGAHAIDGLDTDRWEIAVRYQLIHAVLLVLVGTWGGVTRAASICAIFLTLGIVLFSGSLYFRTLVPTVDLGPVAPVGGVLLTVSWLLLVWVGRARRT